MTRLPVHRHVRLLCLLGMAFCAGCGQHGPARVSVAGTVTLDGHALEQGSILLVPAEGTRGIVAGGSIEQGQYRLRAADGPMAGRHRVEIRAARKTGKKVQLGPGTPTIDEIVEIIPSRYNSATTLEVDLQPGDNTANFELASK